ncbi:MAG: 50S ribosomal protein L6 [Deltaproteobacteria bacterium]|nr:50S ribosomal protein L6 [Deltaproteobacteria bacterium]MBW1955716.1 50S ribosomal protein L6 [Deltaproteobacteria bacterium]MBW2041410.1 50S ribosomal protein L6 [Deltaproteobacteria bacterium]MBW2133084.1 50S ribosomal protein L6 [Deltaproteobacteria bacterium]
MSRVGKKPIPISSKVKVVYKDRKLTVDGPKGSLERTIHPDVDLEIDEKEIRVKTLGGKNSRALSGLTRSLVFNMVTGVENGFERVLEISGIGYRAAVNGNLLEMNLGFSHPVQYELPQGITASVDRNTIVRLSGIDKELLGHTAASIRRIRPPESYKGKGIKYAQERLHLKAGKTGKK